MKMQDVIDPSASPSAPITSTLPANIKPHVVSDKPVEFEQDRTAEIVMIMDEQHSSGGCRSFNKGTGAPLPDKLQQDDVIYPSWSPSASTTSSNLRANIQPLAPHVMVSDSSSCCSSGGSDGGWGSLPEDLLGSLPEDLLGLILDKLLLSNNSAVYDYIRCATVCKSWFRAAQSQHDYRYPRMKNKQQQQLLPLLLIPTVDGSRTHRRLYNIINDNNSKSSSSSSHLISVPYCKRCCGSSHGWLIFAEETLALTLFNPFTGATICLPPLLTEKQLDDIKDDRDFYHEYEIKKVLLSDDPSSNPDNYEVLALQFQGRLALFTSSTHGRRWIYAENYFSYHLGYRTVKNDDIIYFKGKFHALVGRVLGSIEMYNNIDQEGDKPRGSYIRLEPLKGVDEIRDIIWWGQSYLAESINGTLLYVERYTIGLSPPDVDDDDEEEGDDQVSLYERFVGYFEIDNNIYEYRRKDYLLTLCYRVYELEEEEEETDGRIRKFIPVMGNNFEGGGERVLGDQALFLGYNQPVSVRASDFPGCKPNSIYFTDDYCLGEPYKELGPIDFGVYTLGDEQAKPLYMLDPSHTHLPPPIWIVPQPNFRGASIACSS